MIRTQFQHGRLPAGEFVLIIEKVIFEQVDWREEKGAAAPPLRFRMNTLPTKKVNHREVMSAGEARRL